METAIEIASLCGDADTLEELGRRDTRKTVQLAALANPTLSHRFLWDENVRFGNYSAGEYDAILEHRVATTPVFDLVEALIEQPWYHRTRDRVLSDPRLSEHELAELSLELLAGATERYRFQPQEQRNTLDRLAGSIVDRYMSAEPYACEMPDELIENLLDGPIGGTKVLGVLAMSVLGDHTETFLTALADGDDPMRGINGSTVYRAMAQRRDMPPQWYRAVLNWANTYKSQEVAADMSANTDVGDELLEELCVASVPALGRLCRDQWGDDTVAWTYAIESLYDMPGTLGDLIAVVDATRT